jgi:peptide/nickel transport system permease protein
MLSFILKRLAVAIPTLFIVATVTFFIASLVPGDPANYILGHDATPKAVALLHKQLGLNHPLGIQYLNWLGNALHGNLGQSALTQQPVTDSLTQAIVPTLSLAIIATIVSLVVGLALGTLIAVKGGRLDSVIQTLASLGMAIPSFWLSAILVLVFAIGLGWFPAGGYVPFAGDPVGWFLALVLPATAIILNAAAQVILQTRSSVLEVLSKDYVRTLQSVGLSRRSLLLKHVLRNAAIPVLQVAAGTFFFAVSGVVVIEAIFNLNGLGSLLLQAASLRDIPVLQGATLLFGIIVLVANLLIDVATAVVDPRVRVS